MKTGKKKRERLLNAFRVLIPVLEEPRFKNKCINADHGNSKLLKCFAPHVLTVLDCLMVQLDLISVFCYKSLFNLPL